MQKFLSDTNMYSFDIHKLDVFGVMDTLGCYELRHAEPYWKGLLMQTYTIKDLLSMFTEGKGNILVKNGLLALNKKNPSDEPVSYRTTLLEKKPELVADPEVPGIHIICLDKYRYETLETRQRPKLDSVSNSFVEKLPFEKKRLAGMLLLEAVPGLNLLLSCSQSDIINLLNNDTLNTEKGPAKGYYYLGFDRNVYYFKNTIIMTAYNHYLYLPETYIQYSLDKDNTPVTYLNKVNKGIQSRIMDILKEGAVVFTTEDLKRKIKTLIAHILTVEYRKKQPSIPKEVGLFKLEDGTPYDFYLFGKNLSTNILKNQRITRSLSENANLQSFVQPRINATKLREMDFKKYYESEIAKRPQLASYLKNVPTYGDKLERIESLPIMQRQTLAEDLRYEKDYTRFLDKHADELQDIHPGIWDYINGHQTSGSLLERLKDLAKLLAMPREESSRIVDTWSRRGEVLGFGEEEEYYSNNNTNSYMRGDYNGRGW